MSREWHIPENAVDQRNDVLVQDIFFLDKFIRGRATGTHTKSGSGTAEQALKHITLTCPTQPPQAGPGISHQSGAILACKST